MQLHVQLVWPHIARIIHMLKSHMDGGRLQRSARSLARLPGCEHADHDVYIHLFGARTQSNHENAQFIFCAQQLENLFKKFFYFYYFAYADRNQEWLHLNF